MREHGRHAHRRKIAAGPYSFSNVKMEGLIDTWIEQLVEKFIGLFGDGKNFDFNHWVCSWS